MFDNKGFIELAFVTRQVRQTKISLYNKGICSILLFVCSMFVRTIYSVRRRSIHSFFREHCSSKTCIQVFIIWLFSPQTLFIQRACYLNTQLIKSKRKEKLVPFCECIDIEVSFFSESCPNGRGTSLRHIVIYLHGDIRCIQSKFFLVFLLF